MIRWRLLPCSILLGAALATMGCGGGNGGAASTTTPTTAAPPTTISVPSDAPTIADAVKRATPGSLVLVAPGVYRETVRVEVNDLTIRGLDRNTVIIDGEQQRENGVQVFSDGVAVENMTVRNHRANGVLFTGDYTSGTVLQGYRATHLTVLNNGLYGIYAFAARNGVIESSYGSGHPDAAVYVGQCTPCDAVVRDVIAERNQYGVQLTNAGGNLLITGNRLTGNRVGLNVNSSDVEKHGPQRDASIIGNVITANVAADAPASRPGWGTGIAISGGAENLIARNLISGHPVVGVVTVVNERYQPDRNRVVDNGFAANGRDVAFADGTGNCASKNTLSGSSDIETTHPCPGGGPATGGAPTFEAPAPIDYTATATPGPQANLDDPAGSPRVPPARPEVDPETMTRPTS